MGQRLSRRVAAAEVESGGGGVRGGGSGWLRERMAAGVERSRHGDGRRERWRVAAVEVKRGGGRVRGNGGAPWRAPMLGVQLIEEMYIEHLHIKFFHQKMPKTSQIAFIKLP